MNWRAIAAYTVGLWLVLFSVGFLDGLLSPPAIEPQVALKGYIVSSAASLTVASAIFALLFVRQVNRPLLHAVLVLLAYAAISIALGRLMDTWLPTDYPAAMAAIDWFVLLVSLLLGVFAGQILRRWRSRVRSDSSVPAARADA